MPGPEGSTHTVCLEPWKEAPPDTLLKTLCGGSTQVASVHTTRVSPRVCNPILDLVLLCEHDF